MSQSPRYKWISQQRRGCYSHRKSVSFDPYSELCIVHLCLVVECSRFTILSLSSVDRRLSCAQNLFRRPLCENLWLRRFCFSFQKSPKQNKLRMFNNAYYDMAVKILLFSFFMLPYFRERCVVLCNLQLPVAAAATKLCHWNISLKRFAFLLSGVLSIRTLHAASLFFGGKKPPRSNK